MIVRVLVCAGALLLTGCERDRSQGAAEPDSAFGEVPEAGQVIGRGRIDHGGGVTAEGFPPDSRTNYTQKGTGLQKPPLGQTNGQHGLPSDGK